LIIKSHIRGGCRSAAQYLKEQGKNEKTRLVEISDPSARNLDEAFQNMWAIASTTRCTKPLHHISINPMKGESLTDKQLMAIVERCEEKYGYKMFNHQRVIVEHVKDGRQHFHVIWNRVSLVTGKPVWPGLHWQKSKEVCREMENELGLQSPTPRQHQKHPATSGSSKRSQLPRTIAGRRGRINKPLIMASPRRTTGNIIRFTDGSSLTGAKQTTAPKLYIPRIGTPKAERPNPPPMPSRPVALVQCWPTEAILDWKAWGKKDPRAFFRKWPQLAS